MNCPDDEEMDMKTSQQSENMFESPTATQKKVVDDDEETFDVVYENLPENLTPLKECIHKAQGCCLLLILKFFLKEVYSINESKIQNYNPTDTAKVNDRPIMSRKMNRKFNPKSIIEYMINASNTRQEEDEVKRSLVREYSEVINLAKHPFVLKLKTNLLTKLNEN